MASIDPSLLKDASGLSRFTVGGGTPSETYATRFITPSGDYTFIPESVINKGLTVNGNTYFFPSILDKNNLNSFLNQATYVDLSQVPHSGITSAGTSWGDWVTQRTGQSPKGYLVPGDSAIIDSQIQTTPSSPLGGGIKGLAQDQSGNLVYATSGGHGHQYINASNEVHDPYTTYSSFLGDWFGSAGEAVSGIFSDALSAVNSLGPIGTAAISAANPIAGAAVAGANVGQAAAQGNLSVEDLAKLGAAAYVGSQVGSQVGTETGSNIAGNAAATTSAGLLSGQDLGTALTSGAFSGAGTGIANAVNASNSATAGKDYTAGADYSAPSTGGGLGLKASMGEGTDLFGNLSGSDGLNISTALNGAANLDSMGGGQGLTLPSATGTGVLGATGLGNAWGIDSGTSATNPLEANNAIASGGNNNLISAGTSTSLLKSLFGGSSGTGTNNMATDTTTNNAALGSLLGGLLGGVGGLMQGSTNTEAMKQYANAITQAGQQAQNQAAFRPVGMTTSFGTSNFTVDPTTGQITNAGYSLSPQLQAAQEGVLGGLRQNLTDAQTQAALGRGYLGSTYGQPVQNLGSQYMASQAGSPLTQAGLGYLNQSPEQAAAKWMQGQQALLAPSREQSWARLNQGNYNQGTTGLKVAQGGNLQAANPYASALANAQAQQDAALAAQAQQQGLAQQQAGAGLYGQGIGLTQAQQLAGAGLYGAGQGLTQQGQAFGQGLLSSAYQPVNAGLTTAGTIEQLGQNPYALSTNLANLVSQRGAVTGGLGLNAANAAAQAMKQANTYNPYASILSGLGTSSTAGNVLGGLLGSTSLGSSLGNWLGSLGSNYFTGSNGLDVSNIDYNYLANMKQPDYASLLQPGETWTGE